MTTFITKGIGSEFKETFSQVLRPLWGPVTDRNSRKVGIRGPFPTRLPSTTLLPAAGGQGVLDATHDTPNDHRGSLMVLTTPPMTSRRKSLIL